MFFFNNKLLSYKMFFGIYQTLSTSSLLKKLLIFFFACLFVCFLDFSYAIESEIFMGKNTGTLPAVYIDCFPSTIACSKTKFIANQGKMISVHYISK